MDEKLNPKDRVLLMREEGEGNKLQVVKGIDKKGKNSADVYGRIQMSQCKIGRAHV